MVFQLVPNAQPATQELPVTSVSLDITAMDKLARPAQTAVLIVWNAVLPQLAPNAHQDMQLQPALAAQ